jgi:putative oxidoreductase
MVALSQESRRSNPFVQLAQTRERNMINRQNVSQNRVSIFPVERTQIPASIARWAPLPLRLIAGYGFVEHGLAKLLRGPDNFPAILHAIGMPAPKVLAWLTIATEIIGGLCVLLGALVPLVSIPMTIVLLVATFTVHVQYGFSSIKLQAITPNGAQFGQPGYETDLLYLACLIALSLGGAGPLAVDNWLLGFMKDAADRRAQKMAK